ncbi:unnamed protein product [Pylaiella littoralis]
MTHLQGSAHAPLNLAQPAVGDTPVNQEQQPLPQQQPQVRVVLQNVTATINMRITIDPGNMANKIRHAEYNPKKLPALVMRIREPQATGLLFPTGKVVVTGATGVEAAREAANKFVAVVATLGLKPATNPHALRFTVQNMVATFEMDAPVSLELMAYNQARWCMYEPELFPGLVYQTAHRGVVAHIFSSGRVVLTGAKHEDHLNEALVKLLPMLNQYKQPDG